MSTAPLALAQEKTKEFMADASPIKFMNVKTAPQFFNGVIWRAEVSLATSEIGVAKVKNKNAHEFAGFELGEAITVNEVLKDMGIMSPMMDADAQTMVDKIKMASAGPELDRAYIALQLQNHENLRDLADTYLHNTAGATDADEKHGRHLAMLMLAVFKEHVAICKRISGELQA